MMGLRLGTGSSARYSLSSPWSRRLKDTLGPDDDDGGGVFLLGIGPLSVRECK